MDESPIPQHLLACFAQYTTCRKSYEEAEARLLQEIRDEVDRLDRDSEDWYRLTYDGMAEDYLTPHSSYESHKAYSLSHKDDWSFQNMLARQGMMRRLRQGG